jgi:hypothetical protein
VRPTQRELRIQALAEQMAELVRRLDAVEAHAEARTARSSACAQRGAAAVQRGQLSPQRGVSTGA